MAITPLRSLVARWVPPWMAPDETGAGLDHGFRFLYAIAAAGDGMIEAALQGMLSRFPGFNPTALARLSRDRKILRGWAEPDAGLEQRLERWRQSLKKRGTAYELCRQIQQILAPNTPQVRIVTNSGTYYELAADGTTARYTGTAWDWDGDVSLISRFWVIISNEPGLGGEWVEHANTWGGAGLTWGQAGLTWGTEAEPGQVALIRELVRQWKPGDAVCENIIIDWSAGDFDPTGTAPPLPDGTWGIQHTDSGGTVVFSRNPDAAYWDGVA